MEKYDGNEQKEVITGSLKIQPFNSCLLKSLEIKDGENIIYYTNNHCFIILSEKDFLNKEILIDNHIEFMSLLKDNFSNEKRHILIIFEVNKNKKLDLDKNCNSNENNSSDTLNLINKSYNLDKLMKDLNYYITNSKICHSYKCNSQFTKFDSNKKISFASIGVISDKDGNYLITRRSKNLSTFPGVWVFPGGRVDKYEYFEEAVIREIHEEVGIEIKKDLESKKYSYKNSGVKVNNLMIYESTYEIDDFLKSRTIISIYDIKINLNKNDIKLKLQFEEVDAFNWFNKDYLTEILNSNSSRDIEMFVLNDKDSICDTKQNMNFNKHFAYGSKLGFLESISLNK